MLYIKDPRIHHAIIENRMIQCHFASTGGSTYPTPPSLISHSTSICGGCASFEALLRLRCLGIARLDADFLEAFLVGADNLS